MDLIIFHHNCPDGWASAYIAKKKFPEADLLPLNHGLDTAKLAEVFVRAAGRDVLMVDYSLATRALNLKLQKVSKSLRILDHHKTALAELDGLDFATFDMKRSGAGLAWDYLFGINSLTNYGEWLSRPWWVNYTEDQDLWNWALPESQTINAFLMVQSRTIEAWDEITKMSFGSAANAGVGVRQYVEYYTKCVTAEAQRGVFHGYNTALINIPYAGVSEACNALVKQNPEEIQVGAAWFERGDGTIQFSLRSIGDVDVSAIAKVYGGGGHKNASGFQLSLAEGRKLVDQILGR